MRKLVFLLIASVLLTTGALAQQGPLVVRVSGNQLVDGAGNPLQLRGTNFSGLEFAAIQGWSASNPWGGSALDAYPDWKRMKAWGLNTLRIPMNETSWLGKPCLDNEGKMRDPDPGHNYRATLAKAVKEAGEHGFYVILDLHLSAPANHCAMTQNPRPDSENAVAFWKSIAALYGQNQGVIFELFNEPYEDQYLMDKKTMTWEGLRDGGAMTFFVNLSKTWKVPVNWKAAGMQLMLDTVRAAGAKNVVLTSGLSWSRDISQWAKYPPVDPLKQLGAVWHAYRKSTAFNTPEDPIPGFGMIAYNWAEAILAAGYPLVMTEVGDRSANGTTTVPFISKLLPWADKNNVSYMAWTWNPTSDENALVKDKIGTPTDGFGLYYQAHNICRAAHKPDCP